MMVPRNLNISAVLTAEPLISRRRDSEGRFLKSISTSMKVFVEFSPSKAVPGEENTLQLSAQPGFLCGLSAVDKSVHIMEPGKRLDADKIFDSLPVKERTYIPYALQYPVACLRVRPRRYVMPYPNGPSEEKNQPYEVFQKLGLKLATNLVLRVPSCLSYKGLQYPLPEGYYPYPVTMTRFNPGPAILGLCQAGPGAVPGDGFSAAPAPPPIQTVRTFFPETWIWDLVEEHCTVRLTSGSLDQQTCPLQSQIPLPSGRQRHSTWPLAAYVWLFLWRSLSSSLSS
ncbi:murinoglobulin-1 isoform X2 [Oncorhynchus tshawytscha]|uniref:murinoglobulin-1 isoform X2 n=1 Tax=Oncorhynchus tshawytscha TaxID=74940 RepID=UPI001C3E035E|nr:murinoglobulin-1 isoform X2 [Oncorhynchus tshawytscha]